MEISLGLSVSMLFSIKVMETQIFGKEKDLKGNLVQVTLWHQSWLSEILMYYYGSSAC